MATVKSSSITGLEGERETRVFKYLRSLKSDNSQNWGKEIANFIESDNDSNIPYNAFQVALEIVKSLPSDKKWRCALVEAFEILKDRSLLSHVSYYDFPQSQLNADFFAG